jgi:hypothetical protein
MSELGESRIAIVVDPELPLGLLGNAVAVVAVGVGASVPSLGGAPLQDRVGRRFRSSATVAVPVLQAAPGVLAELLEHCIDTPGLAATVAFPEFARSIHDFESYRVALQDLDLATERIAALGIAGEAEVVKRLTRGLKLLR